MLRVRESRDAAPRKVTAVASRIAFARPEVRASRFAVKLPTDSAAIVVVPNMRDRCIKRPECPMNKVKQMIKVKVPTGDLLTFLPSLHHESAEGWPDGPCLVLAESTYQSPADASAKAVQHSQANM